MGIIIKGIEPETGLYILSVDNTGKDRTIFAIAEHTHSGETILRHVGEVVPVVHAHWIKVDKHTVKCSKCGNYLDKRGVNAGRGDALYCPNCGAKMDEEREEE